MNILRGSETSLVLEPRESDVLPRLRRDLGGSGRWRSHHFNRNVQQGSDGDSSAAHAQCRSERREDLVFLFSGKRRGDKKSKKLLLGVSYSVKFQRDEEKLRWMLGRLCVRLPCFYDSRTRFRYLFFLSMDQTKKRKNNQKKLMYYLRFNTEEQFTIQLFYYLMKPDVQF
jgi:hypothetical protein